MRLFLIFNTWSHLRGNCSVAGMVLLMSFRAGYIQLRSSVPLLLLSLQSNCGMLVRLLPKTRFNW